MHEPDFHTPVMLEQVLRYLITRPDGVYLDGTVGGGGHASRIAEALGSEGRVIGIDADVDAIAVAQSRLESFGRRVALVQDNFRNLKAILAGRGVRGVHGVLLDLGVSSFQLDEPAKGFSFRADSRLDMRMDHSQHLTALTVVNEYSERQLAELFWKYGEEKQARRIARRVVQERTRRRIETTKSLAAVVESVVGNRFLLKSLARIFQAIRIEVNDELNNLRLALTDAIDVLERGGRVVVISYHSLEDQIVKHTLKHAAATTISSGTKLVPDRSIDARIAVLTKKPIVPTPEEMKANPRARSAKLRAGEKL